MKCAAYVYGGWHACPEREDRSPTGYDEWDLVYSCRPRFDGHLQPRIPAWGRYDDSDPEEIQKRVVLAAEYGIDLFVHGFFWCRGKRVYQEALDDGFLGSCAGRTFPFAVMWANRMPRHVLPITRKDAPVIEAARLVPSDVGDFVDLIRYLAERYFHRPNYFRVDGKPYLSIYDSTFFMRELGIENATLAVLRAREWLVQNGFPGLHLVAIDPAPGYLEQARAVGFDAVTHYVLLPYWRGPSLQDYAESALARADEWDGYARNSGLPYSPAVSPGWDASPRAADFGRERPGKYPWSPVVTGEHPALFQEALRRACRFAARHRTGPVFIASWNEWSEGHYLEPDQRHGLDWLRAVRACR